MSDKKAFLKTERLFYECKICIVTQQFRFGVDRTFLIQLNHGLWQVIVSSSNS